MASVLIVDDHQDLCRAVMFLIRRLGYQADCVYDGATALQTIRSTFPSLVILDLMMPGMSGLEVLEALHADPNVKGVPVVLYSAAVDASVRRRAAELGAVDCLTKAEIAPDQLAHVVKKYILRNPLNLTATPVE